ncbi:hypothetical protein FSC37_10775 [Piscinibacter aquaticus]|uniref:DNA helicase n=1 Tax=Piscinibacter aquaticus TaxID=392597 RepID=A0A5C6U3E2_9BURK|nr:hypothetical protein FSC37_10775 [Piscinibacter aquaticus]
MIDADADDGAGRLPAANAPTLARCSTFEDEAQAAAAQVLRHLEQGEHPVALIGLDRQLVRRIRALLERQNVPLADETGWTLSTTRAAAMLMALLRAASPRAGTDTLFDALKALPGWPGVERAATLLAELERACRRRSISRVDALPRAALAPPLAEHVLRIEAALAPLREGRATVAEWLSRLARSLRECGAWEALSADAAGQAVLRALRLDAAAGAAPRGTTPRARRAWGSMASWPGPRRCSKVPASPRLSRRPMRSAWSSRRWRAPCCDLSRPSSARAPTIAISAHLRPRIRCSPMPSSWR